MSFFKDFIKEYQITEEQNTIRIKPNPDEQFTHDTQIFREDQNDGSIRIYYPDLEGGFYKYETNSKTSPEHTFYRKRLIEPKQNMKYWQPQNTGLLPFFTPSILTKYAKREKIKTLYLIEGEKKAFKGFQLGLDCIGLMGKNGYLKGKSKEIAKEEQSHELHPDIQLVITNCKPETVVLLLDADTLVINYAPEKNLYTRPNDFYYSVTNFRRVFDENLINKIVKNVFFTHIKAKYNDTAKGFDDLVIKHKAKQKEIVDSLEKRSFGEKNVWFVFKNLTTPDFDTLEEYFGVKNIKNFYETYKEYIGFRQFNYRGGIYKYNGTEIKYNYHEDLRKYMRVGDKYFREVLIPNKHKQTEKHLRTWNKGEIIQDYKYFPSFIDQVPKYNAFCNIPCNTSDYVRVHQNCYNVYEPLQHDIIPFTGNYLSFGSIVGFLKHIFQGIATVKENILGDHFTIALDYLTIMFQKPEQMLPVPCLVSKENNTGKTTFLKLLKAIYGENATVLGNKEFQMPFNAHYITKYLIMIDESFIEVDKKQEKERLKKLVTDDRQFLQYKGVDVGEFDFFGKVIISSNDEDRLMKIDENEQRWFINKVRPYKTEDPFLLDKMIAEIPAFLGFLATREIFHPKESRAWFKPSYIITEQQKVIAKVTRNYYEKLVDEYIREIFETVPLLEFSCDVATIVDRINKNAKYKVESDDVRNYLKDKKGLILHNTERIKIPNRMDETDGMTDFQINFTKKVCRYFVFKASDWLTEDEIKVMPFVNEYGILINKTVEEPKKVPAVPFSKNTNTDQLF